MTILFVCTGNVFRSVAAKYCLEKQLQLRNRNNIKVMSAGTIAIPQKMPSFILKPLAELGIDATKHKQTKIEEKHLKESDLVVAMGADHQIYMQNNFSYDSRLFREICYGEMASVPDVNEIIEDWENNLRAVEVYTRDTIRYIHDSMPYFLLNYRRFIAKK